MSCNRDEIRNQNKDVIWAGVLQEYHLLLDEHDCNTGTQDRLGFKYKSRLRFLLGFWVLGLMFSNGSSSVLGDVT